MLFRICWWDLNIYFMNLAVEGKEFWGLILLRRTLFTTWYCCLNWVSVQSSKLIKFLLKIWDLVWKITVIYIQNEIHVIWFRIYIIVIYSECDHCNTIFELLKIKMVMLDFLNFKKSCCCFIEIMKNKFLSKDDRKHKF